jgi:hypothetical protein
VIVQAVAGSDGSFHAVVPTPSGQSILTVSVTAGGHATGWTQQTVTGAYKALSAGYHNAGITDDSDAGRCRRHRRRAGRHRAPR